MNEPHLNQPEPSLAPSRGMQHLTAEPSVPVATYRAPSPGYRLARRKHIRTLCLIVAVGVTLGLWLPIASSWFFGAIAVVILFYFNDNHGALHRYFGRLHQKQDSSALTSAFEASVTLKFKNITFYKDRGTIGFDGGELVFLGERCSFSITNIVSASNDKVEFKHEMIQQFMTLDVLRHGKQESNPLPLKPLERLTRRRYPAAPTRLSSRWYVSYSQLFVPLASAQVLYEVLNLTLRALRRHYDSVFLGTWAQALIIMAIIGLTVILTLRSRSKQRRTLADAGIDIQSLEAPWANALFPIYDWRNRT